MQEIESLGAEDAPEIKSELVKESCGEKSEQDEGNRDLEREGDKLTERRLQKVRESGKTDRPFPNMWNYLVLIYCRYKGK